MVHGIMKPQIFSKDWEIKDRETGKPVTGTSHLMGVKVKTIDKFGEETESTIEIKIKTEQVAYVRQQHLELRGVPVSVAISALGGYADEGKRAGFQYVLADGAQIVAQNPAPALVSEPARVGAGSK
jgi:hypothetical protein